ncbi:MAG: hypothetical protein ACO2PN_26040 [Pyrobaculum sp.]|jgi:hypothetical protein
MLRGIPLVVLALSVAVVAGYVEVYVEGGPDLDGLHIYAWDGVEWVPVHVIYVPEYIHTYITATGQWASMPHYNMSRYILHIPSEALTHSPPDTPPGLDKWTLEVQNETRRAVVELAVGRKPITKGNLTLSTWYSLGDQPPKTPHRGKFINPPRNPPKNNKAAGEADTASYAVSTGTTIYPIGSLYFQPVKVSGSFNTYVPVDTPDEFNIICGPGLPEMHWVGFEVQNFTVGVKVSGTINYSTLTLEFYNINLDGTCTLITTYSTQLPSSGRWANIDVPLPRDSQIGVRIRVDGYAPHTTTIDVYIAARYVKTVNNPAQIATSKATTISSFSVSSSHRDKIAVFFGPYVAYDGLAATAADTSYSYIYVPPHSARLRWTGQHCPPLTVYYYINGIAYTQRSTAPTTPSPVNGYCRYDVTSTVLQLWARGYTISKTQSKGGEITVSTAYDVRGSPDVTISLNDNLEIVYYRWIEPFHSNYINRAGYPYAEWAVMLLRGTYQVLSLTKNMTSEIRISRSQIALSLAHNQLDPTRHICGAEWTVTVPVSGPGVYYGGRWVEEPWWARRGRGLLLNWLGWLVALGYNTVVSIVVNVVYNLFETASGSASVDSSNGLYIVRWIKGWAEPPPPTVVVLLDPASSSPSQHTEWKYFREGHSAFPWACILAPPRDVNTNIYLPPRGADLLWARRKIWTWRGQTGILTGPLEVGSR